jgi:hypothetical protein
VRFTLPPKIVVDAICGDLAFLINPKAWFKVAGCSHLQSAGLKRLRYL